MIRITVTTDKGSHQKNLLSLTIHSKCEVFDYPKEL